MKINRSHTVATCKNNNSVKMAYMQSQALKNRQIH